MLAKVCEYGVLIDYLLNLTILLEYNNNNSIVVLFDAYYCGSRLPCIATKLLKKKTFIVLIDFCATVEVFHIILTLTYEFTVEIHDFLQIPFLPQTKAV